MNYYSLYFSINILEIHKLIVLSIIKVTLVFKLKNHFIGFTQRVLTQNYPCESSCLTVAISLADAG